MRIRHMNDPESMLPAENIFAAYDDQERRVGVSSVTERNAAALMPNRPLEYLIQVDGAPEALDALLGAATTRAMLLQRANPSKPSRIFVECAPDDAARLNSLKMLGFKDDDGIVRMARGATVGPMTIAIPTGVTLIEDALTDPSEFRFFLERYSLLTQTPMTIAAAWLEEVRRKPRFTRVLLVGRDGLAGEIICWIDRRMGVVGHVHTAPAWRRRGVAAYLMEYSRVIFANGGARESIFDVRKRLVPAMRLAASAGYRVVEELVKYPGIDLG